MLYITKGKLNPYTVILLEYHNINTIGIKAVSVNFGIFYFQAGFLFYFLSVHVQLKSLFHLNVTGPDKLRSNSLSRRKLFTLELMKVHEVCLIKQSVPKILLDT